MMAMLDLIDDGGELAAVPAVQAGAEDRGNLVGGEPPQAEFTTSLEQLVDGKVAAEKRLGIQIPGFCDGPGTPFDLRAARRKTAVSGRSTIARKECSPATTCAPSPTAAATRLTGP